MADDTIVIAKLASWLARVLGAASALTAELDTDSLGVRMPDVLALDPSVQAGSAALADASVLVTGAADTLDAAVASGDEGALVAAFAALLEGLVELFDAVRAAVGIISSRTGAVADPAERADIEDFLLRFARAFVDFLLVSTLEVQRPRLLFLLKVLGLVDWTVVEADPAQPLSRRHVHKAIRLDRVKDLISDPVAHFTGVFGWGTPAFDPLEFFRIFGSFYGRETALRVGVDAGDPFFAKGPLRWSRDSSTNPPGLRLDLDLSLNEVLEGRVGLNDTWGSTLAGSLTAQGGLAAVLTPPFTVVVEPKAAEVAGAIELFVNRNDTPSARPFTIVGGNDLLHLVADDVSIGAGIEIGAGSSAPVEVVPKVFSAIKGLTLTLGSADADSFLASLLGGLDVEGRFDLGLEWRGGEGLVITAAGGLEMAIPMHQSLGVVEFDTLFVVLRINSDGTFTFELSSTITGLLGPITASVERMGVQLDLAFTGDAAGRLGPVEAALAFKPPNGVGLAVDVGVVRGGGYLYLDFDKGEYAGALELVFAEFLALSAVGLISTRMPDGSSGFSLLVIVSAEFGTPLQLGFGFTLIGVGGLLGLNRTARVEELAAGVRDGSIESVMFPTDVVANAPQIISDLRRFFLPEPDTFLVGLMAKLGWGSPTLVTASLGIIIEIPPGNVTLLGVLRVSLPDEDAALLVLQVNFIGAYEVDRERIWFFASLYESRVLFITLNGEMGLLVGWGEDADFLVSVGGFHPSFSPPPLPFPAPRRVSVSLLNESFASVRVEGYFAVTSNTAQFGASAEVFFGVDDFKIDGHISFDALFQFSPFYFIVSFTASLSVKVFGVGLFSVRIRGELEGTSPWYIEGEGSISLLFWDIDVPFSERWGEDADTTVPSTAALPLLQAELMKRDSWVALLPEGNQISVSLRRIEASEALILHPVGTLRVAQRALPLDLHLDKIGSQAVNDVERVSVTVADPDLRRLDDAEEPFATAQFQNLSDTQKLDTPAFEPQPAGLLLGVSGSAVATSHAVKRAVLHELIIIDSNFKEHVARFFNIGLTFFTRFLRGNAAARSPLSQAHARTLDPFASRVTVAAGTFVVASSRDNSVVSLGSIGSIVDGSAQFTSKARADDFVRTAVRRDPALRDAIHVIPATEVQESA